MFYSKGYRQIIIHCGLHKTGSSYLQQLFLANREELSRRSIYFPEFRNPQGAATHMGNHSIVAVSYDRNRNAEENMSQFFDTASGCETLLISGEEFSRIADVGRFIADLKQFAPRADLRFVFYLRRFDHMIESVYSETVKDSLVGDISRAEYQLDYGAIIAPFADAAGAEQIIIRPCNKTLWHGGDIAVDFFTAIGLKSVHRHMRPVAHANQALSRQESFMLSIIRTRRAKQLAAALLNRNPLGSYSNPGRFFRSPGDRRRFNTAFVGDAQRMADRFKIGDVYQFLDLSNFDDDPDWTPFEPDWPAVSGHLVKLSEEMADALPT